MTAIALSVDELIKKAKCKFEKEFGHAPECAGIAPGRVNIIGEHTDYNDGFVFPMALPLCTVVVGSYKQHENQCHVVTLAEDADSPNSVMFTLPNSSAPLMPTSSPKWANYFKGVVANFHKPLSAFNAVISSSVPLGGGLSSSASLEVATYSFLETLSTSLAPSPTAKALACQRAEHQFANMPCGIMDQFVATMAQEDHALLIDCKSLTCEQVPVSDPSMAFVICNSNVRHSLSGSEYPSRRSDCFAAAKVMNKESLRLATLEDISEFADKLSDVTFRRARHVVSEIARTQDAVRALKAEDYVAFGKLMTESHLSLQTDYEVSCKELDELVDLALQVEGVLGSRMTGGGFGGCTVTLVKVDSVNALIEHVKRHYSGRATFYVAKPSKGARSLRLQ